MDFDSDTAGHGRRTDFFQSSETHRLVHAKENISSLVLSKQSERTTGWRVKCVFNAFLLHPLTVVANLKVKLMRAAIKSDPFFFYSLMLSRIGYLPPARTKRRW